MWSSSRRLPSRAASRSRGRGTRDRARGMDLDADPGRLRDAWQDVAGEDLDLVEPVGKAHPEVEDQQVAADLLVALDAAHDVVGRAGEDRPVELLDRRELATAWLDPELLRVRVLDQARH